MISRGRRAAVGAAVRHYCGPSEKVLLRDCKNECFYGPDSPARQTSAKKAREKDGENLLTHWPNTLFAFIIL